METEDNKKNKELYKELIGKHGTSFKALNWGSKESQELRFRILCESTSIANKTILDVGCGLCDLYEYLLQQRSNVKTYTGIDITNEMVQASKKRFPEIEALNVGIEDMKRSFDCVFASGIFTYQSEKFLKEFISKAFEITDHVLAFNALSSWTPDKDEGEFYADPMETLNYCKTLSPWVTLRHDYHARDFTIYLYKNRNI